MAIVEANWHSFLSPDSEIPPDVFFLVVTEDAENADSSKKSFGAHKLLLAGNSQVFRRMFFGPMRETGGVVEVKETTPEAFSTMIDYIYKPHGQQFSLQNIGCPQKLFELLAIADKYEILNLKTLTVDALRSLAISRGNLIFTATVAKNYRQLYDDVGTKLMVRCLKVILDSTTRGGDIFTLVTETKANFPDASFDILHELINVGRETLQLPGPLHLDSKKYSFDILQVGAPWSSLTQRSIRSQKMKTSLPQSQSWGLSGKLSTISNQLSTCSARQTIL